MCCRCGRKQFCLLGWWFVSWGLLWWSEHHAVCSSIFPVILPLLLTKPQQKHQQRSSTNNHWYRHLDELDAPPLPPETRTTTRVIIDQIEDWNFAPSSQQQQQQQNRPSNHEEFSERRVQQHQPSEKLQRKSEKTTTTTTNDTIITNVHELRRKVLDENIPLRQLKVRLQTTTPPTTVRMQPQQHEVVQLIAQRYHTQSKPGQRDPKDTAKLALSLEGGGMRGAVSAGMAAAIAGLGLTDAFDVIYGSSAGSVIGAYMVSRQMCLDVYVDILPAAKKLFVCTKRMFSTLVITALDWALSHAPVSLPKLGTNARPGMNISFVLDGIMDHEHGIRPLDLEHFRANDEKQPLRVASSFVKNGKLYTKCFGTKHFFPDHPESASVPDGRQGLFACLEASMTVPGATGPPVKIREGVGNETVAFFDAFCFEPLPYRSAVEEGATHVLVCCSRPEGFQPKTSPGVYERAVAPIYFRSHGEPEVAEFFERGGQQYIYAEDLLTLEEGKLAGSKGGSPDGIHVPPPKILYGVDRDEETRQLATNRDQWRKAHLLPLKVPLGTPELHTLEQERREVSEAVRGGFAAAFDLLAPAIGLKLNETFTGDQVAKIIFPDKELDELILLNQLRVNGDQILTSAPMLPVRERKRDVILRVFGLRRRKDKQNGPTSRDDDQLGSILPGFAGGKFCHLASSLRQEILSAIMLH